MPYETDMRLTVIACNQPWTGIPPAYLEEGTLDRGVIAAAGKLTYFGRSLAPLPVAKTPTLATVLGTP